MKTPLVSLVLFLATSLALPGATAEGSGHHVPNVPSVVLNDSRVRATPGEERLVLEDGLQPSMVITRTGAIIVQSQLSLPSPPAKRYVSHWLMGTVISRDDGVTWSRLPLAAGENGLNLEGGGVQLRDGALIALDTYIVAADKPGEGLGQLYTSKDDWRTVSKGQDVAFHLPNVTFSGSTDDGGHVYSAERLHRRILELPNGDLLTTIYGWQNGDKEPSGYMPTMRKTRVMLVRSRDHGQHWELVSTVAVDPKVGTEGFGEAVITRISHGAHEGRLIAIMRTGRELYEAKSDDNGQTWTKPYPRVFGDLDVYRTENWIEMFRDVKDRQGKPIADNPNEIIGAVVDPDLLELRSGVLVASFGVRVPPRACWPRAEHPWNGTYIAISLDHGDTWSHVIRMTSGVLTTHYTAIEESAQDNRIFFAHDLGDWRSGRGRCTYGRMVTIAVDGK